MWRLWGDSPFLPLTERWREPHSLYGYLETRAMSMSKNRNGLQGETIPLDICRIVLIKAVCRHKEANFCSAAMVRPMLSKTGTEPRSRASGTSYRESVVYPSCFVRCWVSHGAGPPLRRVRRPVLWSLSAPAVCVQTSLHPVPMAGSLAKTRLNKMSVGPAESSDHDLTIVARVGKRLINAPNDGCGSCYAMQDCRKM